MLSLLFYPAFAFVIHAMHHVLSISSFSSRNCSSLVLLHMHPIVVHVIRVACAHLFVRIIRAFLIEEQKIVKKIGQQKARKA